MTLNTAFFAFEHADSDAKQMNTALTKIRARFSDQSQRIINVETIPPATFLGFQLQAGGVRVWYEEAITDQGKHGE